MVVEPRDKGYFARTLENHGFFCHYGLTVDGPTWLLEGATERARTAFSADGNTQTITWYKIAPLKLGIEHLVFVGKRIFKERDQGLAGLFVRVAIRIVD
jgi:hypothetical protein